MAKPTLEQLLRAFRANGYTKVDILRGLRALDIAKKYSIEFDRALQAVVASDNNDFTAMIQIQKEHI